MTMRKLATVALLLAALAGCSLGPQHRNAAAWQARCLAAQQRGECDAHCEVRGYEQPPKCCAPAHPRCGPIGCTWTACDGTQAWGTAQDDDGEGGRP